MSKFKVGVISDTHGRLRKEALKIIKGSDLIIHAGDICEANILNSLSEIAPVVAVRGNNDKGSLGKNLSKTEVVEIGSKFFYVVHDINDLDLEPDAAGFNVVVFGHSHRANTFMKNKVLYLNPGSAGPRRFKLPVSLAVVTIDKDDIQTKIIELKHE